MSRDVNTSLARALVDEWARAGVTDAALAPGSRSAPLALALAADERIRVHVHLDERSASFFALGMAKATGRPAVVLSTSGTAATHLHAAVLEARHGRVPVVVCTADRPPELRDTGAGQTIDQLKLYGDAPRWFCEVGAPVDRPEIGSSSRSIAARSVAEANGPPAGPVHLNLAFRDPLVPTGEPLVEAEGRAEGRPWTEVISGGQRVDDATVERLAAVVRDTPRGVVVAGWGADTAPRTMARFAARAGWPVIADPISGLRSGPNAISTYDPLLRVPQFAASHCPDVAVRVGAAPTSKAAAGWLGPSVRQIRIDPDRTWLDPHRSASELIVAETEPLLAAVTDRLVGTSGSASEWLDGWLDAERQARSALDGLLDGWEEPFEGRVVRDVVDSLPAEAALAVASSMPVRDVESFARPREGLRFHANRGVNGIDGFVSTTLGIAAGAGGPTAALLGDLCLLHDSIGLLGASERNVDATFVVLDNDGGGIFSFLPQAELPEHFEVLFGTPHGIDLADLARMHRLPVERVEKASEVAPAVTAAVEAGGVRLVIVPTDRADNVERHREAWRAVAEHFGVAKDR